MSGHFCLGLGKNRHVYSLEVGGINTGDESKNSKSSVHFHLEGKEGASQRLIISFPRTYLSTYEKPPPPPPPPVRGFYGMLLYIRIQIQRWMGHYFFWGGGGKGRLGLIIISHGSGWCGASSCRRDFSVVFWSRAGMVMGWGGVWVFCCQELDGMGCISKQEFGTNY